jgi:hypothetical protein
LNLQAKFLGDGIHWARRGLFAMGLIKKQTDGVPPFVPSGG